MTKIKNTKKGMAKKTLSVSLAVAMLATSNVPVWAAEFSDGAEAAFTSEAPVEVEAPVVEDEEPVVENTVEASVASVVEASDLTVSLTADTDSLVWGTTGKKVTGSITGKNGATLPSKILYRWVDEGGIVVKDGSNMDCQGEIVINNNVGTVNIAIPSNESLAGKTISLRLYNAANTGSNFDINTNISVTVNKKTITDFTIPSNVKFSYNGFAQSYVWDGTTDFTVKAGTENVNVTNALNKKNYSVTSTSATQMGDEITLTVTANPDSAYVGSYEKTVTIAAYDLNTLPAGKIGLIASAVEGQAYQYTGNAITIPTEKVSLKESVKDVDNGLFSGANLSDAIKKAETNYNSNGKYIGELTVKVEVDSNKIKNFSNVAASYNTTEKVTVEKRDLSTAGTIITSKKVPRGTAVSAVALKDYISFKGVEGTDLNLSTNDYDVTAKDSNGTVDTLSQSGTYEITVSAKSGNNFLKGSQTFNIEVTQNVITSATLSDLTSKTYYYTGNAVEPSTSDLGTLTITGKNSAGATVTDVLQSGKWEIVGYTNNTAATEYTGKKAYINIKVLYGNFINEVVAIPFDIKALTVTKDTITVPKTISHNKNYIKAEEYKIPVTLVAKDATGKVVKTLDSSDYTVTYGFENTLKGNEVENNITYVVTITNKNYIGGAVSGATSKVFSSTGSGASQIGKTEIVAKALTDAMVSVNPSSYVYTGGEIKPTYTVMDGVTVLYKKGEVANDDIAEYEEVSVTDAVNVGTGKITVKGINKFYSGEATGTFSITPANTSDVKITVDAQDYTGRQIRPRTFNATLNGNDVTNQFEIVSYGENVAGKGTVVLRPVATTKNFTGSDITVEFNIVSEKISAELTAYDSKGFAVASNTQTYKFDFDGNEKKFAKVLASNIEKLNGGETKATVNDLEIKYVDNVTGNANVQYNSGTNVNTAYVYAVAKDGTGFTGNDTITTADGTVIKGVVAKIAFGISSVEFDKHNVTVKNGTYAGGLPVKPEILVQIGGSTLVEGKDYTITLTGDSTSKYTEVTAGKVYGVTITGINGYKGSSATGLNWGIDKKNLADCNVTVKDGVVSVFNEYLPVPTTEYTSKNNGDGTYTVTAATVSKNYTGSKTVIADGKAEDEKPDAPVLVNVKVSGNKATAVLSGEADGATGYDYVISTDRDCITNKDYDKIEKNKLTTEADFTYVQQGVYYAYCHAWKRDENGKKIFSDWSNAYPFVVTAITPDQPVITSVKASGSTVTVTYTQAANATGYDVVLGTATKKVAGETRPVNYGELVKKNVKGNTVTVTFKNVEKGTYYAGLHAFNRTSEDGKKVFSSWSNVQKVTVK